MDRTAPTRRPARRKLGTQSWRRLLFSHWVVPEAALRPLVPARLALDSFGGQCFVGVVAFTMRHVRPVAWAPPVPTARTFDEINVRTYVHLDGEEPGVFFFSLDAGSSLAVIGARAGLSLPYFRSRIRHVEDGQEVNVRCERRWPGPDAEPFEARYEIGPELPPAPENSLEFFLAERYQFYATRSGRLYRNRIHHSPYPLRQARVEALSPALVTAAGLPVTGERTPDYFSPGVDVEIFPPEWVR